MTLESLVYEVDTDPADALVPGAGQRHGRLLDSWRAMPAVWAVAIGTFDGVHRGHQAVIRELASTGLTPTVLTFDPHPRAHFGIDVPMITTTERRAELLHERSQERRVGKEGCRTCRTRCATI